MITCSRRLKITVVCTGADDISPGGKYDDGDTFGFVAQAPFFCSELGAIVSFITNHGQG